MGNCCNLIELSDSNKGRSRFRRRHEGSIIIDANGEQTWFRYVDYNKLGERIDALVKLMNVEKDKLVFLVACVEICY
jgi:hypothetical protein